MKRAAGFCESVALAATGLGASISLHTADPGTTGTAEATGGGYARKTTTWAGGASDGVVSGSQVEFDVATGTYTHYGVWNGSTFLWSEALTPQATFTFAAKFRVTPTVTVPSGV